MYLINKIVLYFRERVFLFLQQLFLLYPKINNPHFFASLNSNLNTSRYRNNNLNYTR